MIQKFRWKKRTGMVIQRIGSEDDGKSLGMCTPR